MKNPLIWIYDAFIWPVFHEETEQRPIPYKPQPPTFNYPKKMFYNSGELSTIDYRPCKVPDYPCDPTYAGWHQDGTKRFEWWESLGYQHRVNGPASIDYYENGQINMETWWFNDKKHCMTGAAHSKFGEDGKIWYQEWWIDGEELSYEDWFLKSDMPLHEKVEMKLKR